MSEFSVNSDLRSAFPTLRDEDWKYTDLSQPIAIAERWLDTGRCEEAPCLDMIEQHKASVDAAWIVIANGRFLSRASTVTGEPGIEVTPLDGAAEEMSIDLPLAGLNTRLRRDGIRVRVSGDRSTMKPVGLLIADTAATSPVMSQTRIDIEVEAGAQARFIEYHASSGDDEHYSNALIQLDLLDGANVRYLRFQQRALHHSQTARLRVRLQRDSHFHHCGIDLGGRLARNDLMIDIEGRGAAARFDGLYIAGDGQHIDNHTRVDHRVGPATSEQEYRGILNGRCQAVWNGKAIVHPGADGTDAKQANHNLVLTERAEIDAKPELEIYADEVKCAHGTTVGQLDKRALFYLRSRGIDEKRARRILTRAFAATVVQHAPISEAHELIGTQVEHRLRSFGEAS